MDALKFIEERNRMCDYYTKKDGAGGCADCPERDSTCNVVRYVTPEYIANVEKWSREHPHKTRQSVFLEQWPETTLVDGVIDIQPCRLVAAIQFGPGCHKTSCYDCRRKFWMQEVE